MKTFFQRVTAASRPLLVSAAASIVLFSWDAPVHAQRVPDTSRAPGLPSSTQPARQSSSQQPDALLVGHITAQLGQYPVVQARYTQTQTRAALRRPLTSGGVLLFARDSGVVWTIDRPMHAVYTITDRGVRQVDDAGADASPAHAPPAAAAQVSRMLRAMLGGDLSALYSQFDVSAQGTATRWRMRLVPNQPQIAQVLRQVDLEGGDFVTALDIVQANGDTLQWSFADQHALPAIPARERAWLSAR